MVDEGKVVGGLVTVVGGFAVVAGVEGVVNIVGIVVCSVCKVVVTSGVVAASVGASVAG